MRRFPAFALGVVFVFLVLAAQFETLTLPLAVILIVPMSLVAAITGVILRGQDNNILTQVGFVVLIGLAAKNAILIVEFANRARRAGKGPVCSGGGSRATADAADCHDLSGLHPRYGPACLGDRRGRGIPSGARHGGFFRNDRRNIVRSRVHAGLLCALSKMGGEKAACRDHRGARRRCDANGGMSLPMTRRMGACARL